MNIKLNLKPLIFYVLNLNFKNINDQSKGFLLNRWGGGQSPYDTAGYKIPYGKITLI